jgi:hypothetical protein
MEHRWSARLPTTTKVTIYHNRIPVVLCRANDIGMGGMFVETGPLSYPRNTTLEVEFELDTKLESKLFHVRACVVYGSEDGLGLVFLDSNSVLTRTIRQMLIADINRIKLPPQDDLVPIPISA